MTSLALLLAAAAAAGPLDDIAKDREDTKKWLRSDPTSYFAAVNRVSFNERTALSVGSGEGADVRVADPALQPRHLTLTLKGEKFLVEAAPGAAFTLGKSTEPRTRAETGPAKVGLGGRFALRLSHQGYPAVIVFDAKSPRFKEYKGIPYFKPDLAYRYAVRLTPDPAAERTAIQSSASADRKAVRVGWFDFAVGTVPVRLAAHRLDEPGSGPEDLSVFFRDATTGKESYKVGRYVEPVKQPDGSYVLDFNMAYNPACAYSNFYNCPIPPRENHLKVPIRAGEKDPGTIR